METIIYFNDKKRLKSLLMGVGITLVAAAFLYFIIFVDNKLRITYLLFFGLLFFAGLYILFIGIKEILEKDKRALIFSNEGILSRETQNARKIGLVPWSDISSLSVINLYKQRYVSLIAKDKSKYLGILKGPAAKQLNEQGVIINISSDETDTSFEDLYKLVESYFNKQQREG